VVSWMRHTADPRISRFRPGDRGFTLIEVLMVVVIIAILACIAIPVYLGSRAKAKSADCLVQRQYAERAARAHDLSLSPSLTSHDLPVLVSERLIDQVPICPSGGTYSWGTDKDGQPVLYCSVHAPGGSVATLTALGSTFSEITTSLIKLIDAFYAAHGYYPRSWGDFRWTDLGLTAADWQAAVDHLTYKPAGSAVRVRPAAGFVMVVTNTQGVKLTLTNNLNWDLVYDNATGQWYYHTIDPANKVDISTLVIKPA
jgi:prepilin-type N-terminal cleavage/methylation domain-containing protein